MAFVCITYIGGCSYVICVCMCIARVYIRILLYIESYTYIYVHIGSPNVKGFAGKVSNSYTLKNEVCVTHIGVIATV